YRSLESPNNEFEEDAPRRFLPGISAEVDSDDDGDDDPIASLQPAIVDEAPTSNHRTESSSRIIPTGLDSVQNNSNLTSTQLLLQQDESALDLTEWAESNPDAATLSQFAEYWQGQASMSIVRASDKFTASIELVTCLKRVTFLF